LRASKRQKREERKEDIEREQEEKAEAAELRRLEIETAGARLSKHRRDRKKGLDILPQTWKKGVRKNVIERVRDEMSTIWPITKFTEFEDREVAQIFKIRYTPKSEKKKVPFDQYHALLMKTEQEKKKTQRSKRQYS
jgi:hypothetical protein